MRNKRILILILLPLVAAALVWAGAGSLASEPDYTVFSTGNMGVSLLYDTLRQMQYPVAPGYSQINTDTGVNDVFFIIQPDTPSPDIDAILSWVRMGGRLVYLDDSYPSLMDMALYDAEYDFLGDMTYYTLGLGEVVTGSAGSIVNSNLMYDNVYGEMITYLLDTWSPTHIYFVEYYHGYQQGDNFFRQLPAAVKIVIYQIIIATVALLWLLGKRFGKPIPYYEEIEREENEHVKALARLYYRTDKRRGKIKDSGRRNK